MNFLNFRNKSVNFYSSLNAFNLTWLLFNFYVNSTKCSEEKKERAFRYDSDDFINMENTIRNGITKRKSISASVDHSQQVFLDYGNLFEKDPILKEKMSEYTELFINMEKKLKTSLEECDSILNSMKIRIKELRRKPRANSTSKSADESHDDRYYGFFEVIEGSESSRGAVVH